MHFRCSGMHTYAWESAAVSKAHLAGCLSLYIFPLNIVFNPDVRL
jgi:hypothetical protein